MAGSTYAYCFRGCPMNTIIQNRTRLGLQGFAGVVGVDHYYTKQGMPCVDGKPREFEMQQELAQQWKGIFPEMRFMTYRILSAVPYTMVVQDKIESDPDFFVRWQHQAGSAEPGNGSVCYNYVSACFNDPTRINDPAHNCSFEIRAAAYNWARKDSAVRDWFVQSIIAPALDYADGVWLDGIGPDNGAYMCAGVCCGYGPDNSPHNLSEIHAQCDGMEAAGTAAQQYLLQHGGYEMMMCSSYRGSSQMPSKGDSPGQCASKLREQAAWASDHSNYNMAVAYGSRTGGSDGYDDDSVDGAVAAFLLVRQKHWLFSLGSSPGEKTARLIVSDYGAPLGNMTQVSDTVFQREFEQATVQLDCSTFKGTFTPRK